MQQFTTTMKNAFSSLQERMKNSYHAKFHKSMEDVDEDASEYKLPEIVVVGSQSTGKTSVIENITKVSIFPRKRTHCTKMPVRINMHYSENDMIIRISDKETSYDFKTPESAHTYLSSYMDKTNDTDKELSIDIWHNACANLTLIDLPGITEFPPESAKHTKSIVQSYTNNIDNIILAIVDSQEAQLTSTQALGMIINDNRMNDTIIALTKIDKLDEEDMQPQLLDRIYKTRKDEQLESFSDVIGIVNRTQDGTIQKAEEKNTTICESITKTHKEYEYINEHIGTNALIKNIDNKFNNHIRKTWVPNAITKIDNDIESKKKELENLGPDPLTINTNVLIKTILHEINTQIENTLDNTLDKIEINIGDSMEDTIKNRKYIINNLNDIVYNKMIKIYQDIIDNKYTSINNTDYYIKRFEKIFILIKNSIRDEIYCDKKLFNQYIKTKKPKALLSNDFIDYIDTIINNTLTISLNYTIQKVLCEDSTISRIVETIKNEPSSYIVENEEYSEKRQQYYKQLYKLETSKKKMNDIRDINCDDN